MSAVLQSAQEEFDSRSDDDALDPCEIANIKTKASREALTNTDSFADWQATPEGERLVREWLECVFDDDGADDAGKAVMQSMRRHPEYVKTIKQKCAMEEQNEMRRQRNRRLT